MSDFKLRPYQVEAISGARRAFIGDKATGTAPARAVIVTMPTGCHAKGQPIMMADRSIRAVETIQVGEHVMGPWGLPRTVLGLHRGRQEMARIVPMRGNPWDVNMDHVLTLAIAERSSDAADMLRNQTRWTDITVAEWIRQGRQRAWLMRADLRTLKDEEGPRYKLDGFTVQTLPEADYYGFELDGDGRYLLADGTVTHNSGKSVVFKAIAQGVAERGRRVLLLVEGIKLVHQAARHLREAGLTVGIEMAEYTAVPEADLSKPQRELYERLTADEPGYFVKGPSVLSASILCERGLARKVKAADMGAGGWYVKTAPEPPQIVVASVDSMTNRLDRYEADAFRMVIVDECFPAGTVVDGRPIETIKVGDHVRAYNPRTGLIELRPVVRLFKNPVRELVRLHLSEGPAIVCTPDHPFATSRDGGGVSYNFARDMAGKTVLEQQRARARAQVRAGLVQRPDGGWTVRPGAVVVRVEPVTDIAAACPDGHVYNFEVEGLHNYFVNDILVHNCHHSISPSYLAVFEHFGISVPKNNPKDKADLIKSPWKGDTLLFGLTATPDRGDKQDLMRLFDAVGYEYDIRSAIQDGWLVPIRQEFCHLEGLDLRQVRKSAGDLDARQLCELLEPLMVPICESIKSVSAGRPTLCYSPLCNLANSTTAQLRLIAPDKQIHTITGETEDAQREAWFAGLDKGEVWALSSVGTLTEGVDLPRAAVAAMLRLTMSRLLYAQILGRVLRPAPEIAHALNDCATAEERRAMIAASSKPTATILDFAGNSGKHKLVRAIDILADDEDPAKKMAEIIMEKGEVDPFEALERARAELAVMLEKARGKDIQRILVSPFDLLDVPATKDAWGRPATDRQIASLLEAGVIDYRKSFPKLDPREREAAELRAREEAIAKLRKLFDMTSASIVLAERSRRIDEDMANPKQLRVLIKAGIPAGCARAMGFKTASAAIDQLSAMGWKATPMWIERWSAARMEVAA